MKHKTVYQVGDCSEEDLDISKDDYSGDEPGEFTFATLAEAKKYCLGRLDSKISELERVRAKIKKAKG